MSDYTNLVNAVTAIYEEHDGNVPDTGVALLHGPAVYAAYAYLNGDQAAELSDWYADAEDAFQGEYASDEDFAQSYADEIAAVDPNASWPLNCIDWTFAARKLMYDYSAHDGLYFRDL